MIKVKNKILPIIQRVEELAQKQTLFQCHEIALAWLDD